MAVCAAPAFAAGKLSVSYPYEGQKLPEISKMFIFGQAPDGKGRLTINGTRVKLFKTGTFIAYLPVSTGTFVFSLDYSGRTSASLKRTVSVASHPPFILPAGQIGIDVDSLAPQDDARLRAGDWLPVSMLIPGNIPNIISASKLNIKSREWASVALPLGAVVMLVYFVFMMLVVTV